MTKFLERTAAYLFDHHRDDLRHVCVVLPSRRAALFLKKYLSLITDKPIFAPEIFSIEDFVFSLSGYRKIAPAYLLFEFYEVYREMEGDKAGSFREFVRWAEVVIQDFNEIDLYLVDPEQLFGYLTDAKAIALWNLDERPLTDFEARYLQFFNSLAELYRKLSKKLMNKSLAWQGMAYRELSAQLDAGKVSPSWSEILFVGFNALTASEERIIETLQLSNKVKTLWDADHYYLDDPQQEAGHFLRRIRRKTGIKIEDWITEDLEKSKKEISLIGVPKNIGQAKAAGNLISELQKVNPDLENSAIVLNDENLLFPVLNSLPESVKAFNLTMGLPLKKTILYSLVSDFIQLNENALRFDRSGGQSIRFYHKDLLRIMEHPYFARLTGAGVPGSRPARQLRSGNRIFYRPDEVTGLLATDDQGSRQAAELLFRPWMNSARNAVDGILFLLKRLKSAFTDSGDEADRINTEYVFHFSMLFNKLKSAVEAYPFLDDLESFRQVFMQMVRSINIPFYGEPLQGVQIMGMLETRTLDFENIIMLSVNEDFIPGRGFANSFIPYEIRRQFKLPTHRERNAVSAYHFFRLLQRAKKVHLLYNTEAGELGGGDRSRFITQLEYELGRQNPGIKIKKEILSVVPDTQVPDDSIQVEKEEQVMEIIRERARRGFSASALNALRNCSLRFYFKYALGLDESEEVEETMEASTMGSVVHDVLFKLYTPLKGRKVDEADFKKMETLVEPYLNESFRKNYPGGDISSGKNHLISKVAETYVRRFISSEKELYVKDEESAGGLIIEDLEVMLDAALPANGQVGASVRLKGVIDRVDRHGGLTRIIDYKTGRVEPGELRLKMWEDLLIPGKYDKLFQLLFYAYLYHASRKGGSGDLEAGILSFRSLSNGLMTVGLPGKDDLVSSLKDFEDQLNVLTGRLFDAKIPFVQTADDKVCEYCTFKSICHR